RDNGAAIIDAPTEVFAVADVIVKVKEPQKQEFARLRRGQVLFTYLHFAASETLTRSVLETGATAAAYETLRGKHGDLPCLTPMRIRCTATGTLSASSSDGRTWCSGPC